MSITQELKSIFSGEQKVTDEEQSVLEDAMLFYRDDVELGLVQDVLYAWYCKIMGIIEFLRMTGRIDEKQDEDLCMLLNAIEAGKGE